MSSQVKAAKKCSQYLVFLQFQEEARLFLNLVSLYRHLALEHSAPTSAQLTPSCPLFFLGGLNHFLSDLSLSFDLCRFLSEHLEDVFNLCIEEVLAFTAKIV